MQCINCGKELTKYQKKFCSNSCSATFYNKDRKGVIKVPKPSCATCGKMVNRKSGKFCSYKCSATSQTKYTPDVAKAKRKEIYRLGQQKYRAKNLRHLDPTANTELLTLIYSKCPNGWEVDHIIPLSKEGKHHENNLQYLPALENRSKGNRLIYSAVNREYSVREVIKEYLDLK